MPMNTLGDDEDSRWSAKGLLCDYINGDDGGGHKEDSVALRIRRSTGFTQIELDHTDPLELSPHSKVGLCGHPNNSHDHFELHQNLRRFMPAISTSCFAFPNKVLSSSAKTTRSVSFFGSNSRFIDTRSQW